MEYLSNVLNGKEIPMSNRIPLSPKISWMDFISDIEPNNTAIVNALGREDIGKGVKELLKLMIDDIYKTILKKRED
jgi:hypothetical protein